jgi:hypothetical protein
MNAVFPFSISGLFPCGGNSFPLPLSANTLNALFGNSIVFKDDTQLISSDNRTIIPRD